MSAHVHHRHKCMHTSYTSTHTYFTHTHTHTHKHTHKHTHTHTNAHTYAHTQTHTCTLTHTHTQVMDVVLVSLMTPTAVLGGGTKAAMSSSWLQKQLAKVPSAVFEASVPVSEVSRHWHATVSSDASHAL